MIEPTRREFVQSLAALTAMTTTMTTGAATGSPSPPPSGATAFTDSRVPVPLPFSATKLTGISDKLIQSHWENNYGGAVKALNLTRSRLAAALKDPNTPPYLYNGLKREQLIRTGSVVLHEAYFANLGGDGKAPADVRSRLGSAFGTYDDWETEFRKIGQGLGGGSGWVVLGYDRGLDLVENYWLADHATNPPNTTPLLVMDMYEHAYQMDYGANAAKYIDAFFQNIQWDEVARRFGALTTHA